MKTSHCVQPQYAPKLIPPGSMFFIKDGVSEGIHLMVGWFISPVTANQKFISLCNGHLREYFHSLHEIYLVEEWERFIKAGVNVEHNGIYS